MQPRRPTRINPNMNTLILNPIKKPRHLPQLLPRTPHRTRRSRQPSRRRNLVPDPQRMADALELDAQRGHHLRQRRERPVRAVGRRAHGRRVHPARGELHPGFDPFARGAERVCAEGGCGAGEYDQAALVPFQGPVGADGYLGYDEGVVEGCEDYGGGGGFAVWGFAPEVCVWVGFHGEVFHALGEFESWGEV